MIITQAGKYNYEFQALDDNELVLISKDIEEKKQARQMIKASMF